MVTTVGSGKHTFEVDEDWARLPEGWEMPAAAVAVDSQDRVFVFNRALEHPIAIFDREGNYLSSWGEGLFVSPHAILIDREDNVWLVDADGGQVMKFTPSGDLLMAIGTRGYRSDTGFDPVDLSHSGWKEVKHGGEPFNLPAGVALAPSGDIFVADGYANSRVHKFSAEGKLLLSWGEPGSGPGEFNLPHGICIDKRGRVLVADEQNQRVQVFTQEGTYITTWPTHFIGPASFYVDDDTVYIVEHDGGLVSIVTLDGERLARWGSEIHWTCHSIGMDSRRDIYVVQPGEWGQVQRTGDGRELRYPRRVVKFIRKS